MAAKAISSKNGLNIQVIGISDISVLADYMVIATGTSSTHVKALADELCVYDEVVDGSVPHTIFDPNATWKTKTLTDFTAKELLVPIFKNGKCVYESPSIQEIAKFCKAQIELLWDEVKRFENPHTYYVDLSKKLYEIKNILLNVYGV